MGLRSFKFGLFEGKESDPTSRALQLRTGGQARCSRAKESGRDAACTPVFYAVLKYPPLELGKAFCILCAAGLWSSRKTSHLGSGCTNQDF